MAFQYKNMDPRYLCFGGRRRVRMSKYYSPAPYNPSPSPFSPKRTHLVLFARWSLRRGFIRYLGQVVFLFLRGGFLLCLRDPYNSPYFYLS